MIKSIADFFAAEKIKYFAALDYGCCARVREHLIERLGALPRSVIIFLVPYFCGHGKNLSSYATSRDYHMYSEKISERFSEYMKEKYPEYRFVGYSDHSPIDERDAACKAGLGILGDNRLLINAEYGTYVFISEIITDMPPEELGVTPPLPIKRCEGCGACKEKCPTRSLTEGKECLSAITQRKGELTDEQFSLMRKINTVWGCDECQKVCPHNENVGISPIAFFHEERIEELTSELLSNMTESEFASRAFSWRGRKTVERNLKNTKK